MGVNRVSSNSTLIIAILTAGFLVTASLDIAPNRLTSLQAGPRSTESSHPSSTQPETTYNTPLAKHTIAGGFFRIDHTFEPTLIITNALQNLGLPVTPILYSADGTEYQLPTVTLPPAGVYSIDIRAALSVAPDEINNHFSDYGSAAVKYVWHWPGAASAMVQNLDAKRSLNFNFELRKPMAMQHGAASTVQEGLWWKEDRGVKGFLALINTARRPINVRVQILSDYGAFESETTMHLQPNQTRNFDLLENSEGLSGGVRVSYFGNEGVIALAGGLENPREGYSAQIPFLTISPDPQPSTIAVSSVGLMYGTPDPMMKFPSRTQFGVYLALRNTSVRPILVFPTIYYMQGADVQKSTLKTLALAAGQARHWTPEELSSELALPQLNGMINLTFSYQGGPSDVIMANGSIDQTKNFVFEVNMQTVGKSQAKDLKAWDVSGGNDTMMSLLNLGENDQDLLVTFFFDGGRYKLPIHLKPGGSAMVNLSEVIVTQQPDADGNKIPAGTLHGTSTLSGASGYPEWINIGVAVGIFNVSTATCGNTCPGCFGYTNFKVLPFNSSTFFAAVGGTASFQAWAFGQDNLWHNVSTSFPQNGVIVTWSSGNTNVATSQGIGNFSGVSPGTFAARANATLLDVHADCPAQSHTPCPNSPYFASSSGLIQQPTSLALVSVSVLPDGTSGAHGCLGSFWAGIRVDIKYQVLDQQIPPQPIRASNMTPHEQGIFFGGGAFNSNIGPVPGYPTSGLTTAADGTFHDVPFGTCAQFTFSNTATQNITMILGTTPYSVRSQTWTASGTTTGTTTGHGTISNGIDVSASR